MWQRTLIGSVVDVETFLNGVHELTIAAQEPSTTQPLSALLTLRWSRNAGGAIEEASISVWREREADAASATFWRGTIETTTDADSGDETTRSTVAFTISPEDRVDWQTRVGLELPANALLHILVTITGSDATIALQIPAYERSG